VAVVPAHHLHAVQLIDHLRNLNTAAAAAAAADTHQFNQQTGASTHACSVNVVNMSVITHTSFCCLIGIGALFLQLADWTVLCCAALCVLCCPMLR
jgi:hypothetical protein